MDNTFDSAVVAKNANPPGAQASAVGASQTGGFAERRARVAGSPDPRQRPGRGGTVAENDDLRSLTAIQVRVVDLPAIVERASSNLLSRRAPPEIDWRFNDARRKERRSVLTNVKRLISPSRSPSPTGSSPPSRSPSPPESSPRPPLLSQESTPPSPPSTPSTPDSLPPSQAASPPSFSFQTSSPPQEASVPDTWSSPDGSETTLEPPTGS